MCMPEPGKTPPKDVHSNPLTHRAVHRYGLGDVQGRNNGSRKVAHSRYCPAVDRKAASQPAEARAEAVGHDGNDQQRGRGMVTNAAASRRPIALAATHGSPSMERQTACRISRIQACHPRVGQVSSA
jgi:hypothetical protein